MDDDDDRPPICPRCGVTMVPAALSADKTTEGDWVCLECEELDEEELGPTPTVPGLASATAARDPTL